MKVIKTISIDSDLSEYLSNQNASTLINDLLATYFNNNSTAFMKQNIRELMQKRNEINKNIRDLKKKVAKNMKIEGAIVEKDTKKPKKLLKLWQDGVISDAEYWSCFPKIKNISKFDSKIAEKLIERGLKKQ